MILREHQLNGFLKDIFVNNEQQASDLNQSLTQNNKIHRISVLYRLENQL
jgi:hypothetical protein